MPLFISDDELRRLSGDAGVVAEKADAFIRDIYARLETVKAEADAASITAEQTCSLLEQRYLSLSSDYAELERRYVELDGALQQRASEIAQVQADKHQLHLKAIERDGVIERLSAEISELHKSKRQLLELLEAKDMEISEKNSAYKSYLDKIADLTDRSSQREAKVSEMESELARCKGSCNRLAQEKELIEKHNVWLNDELTVKVDSLLELRRRNAEIEADLSARLKDMERQYNECSNSLNQHKERVRELESKMESLQQELYSARDDAAAAEQRYSAEISTVSKLVDLYKESSDEWSKKAGELEGVIKALETHLSQTEGDYKEKLEKEEGKRNEAEQKAAELSEKLAKCEAELEASRKSNELEIIPLSTLITDGRMDPSDTNVGDRDNRMIVPHIPAGVSGTALAASLLREGWSLAKMYAKYQEAADALRHEQLGRKQTQAILERVLLEIEEKAAVILDERAEHERMAEAYSVMNQKLQQSLSEQANLERAIRELKADLRRRECEYNFAQKEITDLQKQVTVLLKECRDIQLRYGSSNHEFFDYDRTPTVTDIDMDSEIEKVISEQLLTFKDINGLVEQNAKLRSLVRSLSDQIENAEKELKEQFEKELQKHEEAAASRVSAVLERAEEQGKMIESLHSSVAMYRRLYEEEHKLRSSHSNSVEAPSADGRKDIMLLLEGSQEATKKAQEQAAERVRCLEEEIASCKGEIILLRSERDKLALEANFSREKLERFMKEYDHQREEMNGILARNIEFSQMIVDYQRKLRESSESVDAADERSRKLNMELSMLKHEKELLMNSEKRACDEVRDLSERLHRLQATLDTIHSTEEVREEARAAERRKQEEYVKQIEREWAEAKKELQEERNNVRSLSLQREHIMQDAMRQVEEMRKELSSALQAVATAEARAAVAETRYSDLEKNWKSFEAKIGDDHSRIEPSSSSTAEIVGDLRFAKGEIERLKSEAQANKDHMMQYKNIAEVNEAALKQMENAHENFKLEADQLKKSLEVEIQSLRDRVCELENESGSKLKEAASAVSEKGEALASALSEITKLKEENSKTVSQFVVLEVQVTVLKEDLEMAHQRARAAQANYERQVILQSETIQELTKTSQSLASLQGEAAELRKMADACKCENNEVKAKWEEDKSELEKSKTEAEKRYNEVNEQNKTLLGKLESMHIKLAETDRDAAGITSTSSSADPQGDNGLHGVISYLRRSKEIAETEISLLKQEKLRLQSQLEKAIKASEAAQASLSAERANSSSFLFTEDEFKSLQLKVREMNLLRESNMQLREENKHNFEECQKLREVVHNTKVEAENLQTRLREKETEADVLRKQFEKERAEKEKLEKRIAEVLESSKNIDVQDYDRLKSEVEQMRASMREKDAQIEELRTRVSEKEEIISKLEQEIAGSRSSLAERHNQFLDVEATLKSDLEKQKKFVAQLKRRFDVLAREKESHLKEKESLSKEKESLSKEKESWLKERESLMNEKESLSREKEELSKEIQAVSKQLEDLRLEKKSIVDATGDQATRDKEKEKDARIHILENTLKKDRDTLKKLKEKYLNMEKVITTKATDVDQQKMKIETEQERHKDAVRKISDELERLKHARDSLPEGTSLVQLLASSALDDRASAYKLAIETFEKVAHSILMEMGAQVSVNSAGGSDTAATSQASHTQSPVPTSTTAMAASPVKMTEEREKKISLPRSAVETRKSGRRLVRPRLQKSAEAPHRDVEMSEGDGSNNEQKPATAQDVETQPNVSASTEPSMRKRSASPFGSELPEEAPFPGETSDSTAPALKKSKGLEPTEEDLQGQSAEELFDAAGDVSHGSLEDATETGKEEAEKEHEEPQQSDDVAQADLQKDNDNSVQENVQKPSEADPVLDEVSDLQIEQEEGELVAEVSDIGGRDDMADPTGAQDVTEPSNAALVASPARLDDEPIVDPVITEPNEEGELIEDAAEGSDKSNDGNDPEVGEGDQAAEAASAGSTPTVVPESSISKDANPSVVTDANPSVVPSSVTSTSTTINLTERARQRAAARLAEFQPSGRRGRGGPVARGRATRGRGGRRHTSPGQS